MNDKRSQVELHSGVYVENYERKPLSRLERLVPLMHLEKQDLVADFACGNAMLLPLIHDKVAQYHGIDFSPDFIASARRRADANHITNCNFYCEDISSFCDQHRGMFDVATAFDFSEHIDDDDFIRFFGAIRTSLRVGGRLYLHTPNLSFLMERCKDHGIIPQFPEHIAVRNATENLALLARAGFTYHNISVHRIAHYNALKVLHPLRHIPLIGDMFAARLFIECRN